jgi:uncharacterized protein (TIGR02996 family)
VTTEGDFHRAIDAQPDDWQTRLVFADWLQERGDPRAEGYRALVALGKRAKSVQMATGTGKLGPVNFIFGSDRIRRAALRAGNELCLIPQDWLKLFSGSLYEVNPLWRHYHTRREAEDAAAVAFAGLPAKRRARLLKPSD